MKETEEIELNECTELNEVELSEEEIKKKIKWIEDAEKSGRIFLIFIESFVVISIVLLVAVGAVSYEYNWLSPCIELKSKSWDDVTCKTGNFAFGFSSQNGDEPQDPLPKTTTTLRPDPGNIGSQMLCICERNFVEILITLQRRRIIQKDGGASSTMAGIICPPWSE